LGTNFNPLNGLFEPLPGQLSVVGVSSVLLQLTGGHICLVVSSAPSANRNVFLYQLDVTK
jgi:hypothetical protein